MIKSDKLEKICLKYNAAFCKDEVLAPYTTFKIGGTCDIFIKINSRECLRDIVLCCKNGNIPCRVIGRGSNILIGDEGVKGAVLLLGGDFAAVSTDSKDNVIFCDAGASLTSLCLAARDNSLTGLEFAYGIPGSVGGAVYMNAGAYDGEISQVIRSCEYLDADGSIKKLNCFNNPEFSHRKSPFTCKPTAAISSKKIILSAEFALTLGKQAQINAKMEEFMKRRKDKQPLEFPSAGSTFKRPGGDYASRLVDICGLKGLSVGGAQVSKKHAGFIINKGNATCKDVLELIEIVRARVLRETGINLEREVEILK
ncbi:MAG: UDP-N-acetylmuramate dehydrogenase [Oscillospiraceae bacterium]|nr:UDP-N-acetylmuramate dehydrogenase [Oscillospiraceae bacterium]